MGWLGLYRRSHKVPINFIFQNFKQQNTMFTIFSTKLIDFKTFKVIERRIWKKKICSEKRMIDYNGIDLSRVCKNTIEKNWKLARKSVQSELLENLNWHIGIGYRGARVKRTCWSCLKDSIVVVSTLFTECQNFYFVQKLSAFQCVVPLTFL